METIYVTKPYLPSIDDYYKYLIRIWESNILTNKGPLHVEFKERLAAIIDSKNINLFCNGHSALEIAIKSLEMEKGEIITTPFTFVSTTHAIVNTGNTPVFCDIKPEDMTIDEDKIEELITDRTIAILPVHVYGFPCNVDAIERIANKHGLRVIYDAAHAFGVFVNGQNILKYGDISMVSFHATKLFNTIEGGMTVSRDSEIAHKQELLQNFGIASYEDVELIGSNAKMNEFSAAMGLATIDDLGKIIERRQQITYAYAENLSEVKGIRMFLKPKGEVSPNYAYLPILIDPSEYGETRDELAERLMTNNIFARKYFYPLTCDMKCYRKSHPWFSQSDTPIARYTAENILTLPIYYDMTNEQVKKICKVIKR